MSIISFNDFQKLELIVAQIKKIEEIQNLDRLYKLILDVGNGARRTVIAGIRKWYKAEDLEGKQVVYCANLEPRIIRGIKSEGMILAADENDKPILISPRKKVKPGTKIR